jgi:hypothetical protein
LPFADIEFLIHFKRLFQHPWLKGLFEADNSLFLRPSIKSSTTLLYVGISPDKIGKPNSRQNLRRRITTHFQGNAEGSTLRRSLGVLLAGESGYPLRRVGSGKRMTFTHSGEQWLDDWMTENAFVCWLEHQSPWEFEDELISSLSLPLNIKGNRDHPFARVLTEARIQAIKDARQWPIAVENNRRRKSVE